MRQKRFMTLAKRLFSTSARLLPFLALTLLGVTGCSHVVTIESEPPGARVKIDGVDKGNTPLVLTEDNGFFAEKKIEIELEGYLPVETELSQSEIYWPMAAPACALAPFTFGISLFLCSNGTKYAEVYTYEMSPASEVSDGSFMGGNRGEEEPVIDDPAASVPF